MSYRKGFVNSSARLELLREGLHNNALNVLREILSDRLIREACVAAQFSFRERLLTPVVTIMHCVLAALWPELSFASSWQMLWAGMCARCAEGAGQSPSSGSLAKARARLPLRVWQFLSEHVARHAEELGREFNQWRGHRLVLLDGTCLSMSAHEPLFIHFGSNSSCSGRGKYPLTRVVAAVLAATKVTLAYQVGKYCESEWPLTQRLLGALRANDLIIADRFYAAAHYYHCYRSAGLHFLTRMHQRLQPRRLKRLLTYSRDDFIARLPISAAYRRSNPELPEGVDVRFVRATIRTRSGREDLWLATLLLDACQYPAAELVQLYRARWHIEEVFEELKVGLGADILRSQTPLGVHKEIAARIVAHNAIRSVMLQAARQANVCVLRLSFVQSRRTVLAYSAAFASAPLPQLLPLYRSMLREIASHRVRARPGRQEPRMIRRERIHYPTLKTTRAAWRDQHAA